MAPSLEDGIGVAVNIFMIARRFEDLEAWQLANEGGCPEFRVWGIA